MPQADSRLEFTRGLAAYGAAGQSSVGAVYGGWCLALLRIVLDVRLEVAVDFRTDQMTRDDCRLSQCFGKCLHFTANRDIVFCKDEMPCSSSRL